MAERDVARGAAWLTAHNKAGKQIAEWLFQVVMALLMKQHCKGCGDDDLGEAGNVVNRVGLDCGRVGLVGEMSQAADRKLLAGRENAIGATGEDVRGDRIAEDICERGRS